MNDDSLGLNHLVSLSATCQTVKPLSVPLSSGHLRIAPPQGSSGMPRCLLYQAASAALSLVLLKKTPPIPVTFATLLSLFDVNLLPAPRGQSTDLLAQLPAEAREPLLRPPGGKLLKPIYGLAHPRLRQIGQRIEDLVQLVLQLASMAAVELKQLAGVRPRPRNHPPSEAEVRLQRFLDLRSIVHRIELSADRRPAERR